ncbi:unnamed protein product [Clonostachys rhizophaga]|uniref:Uncharacterized protein n=1 Tax=Clonostachys rhizophaga TaxID=160324 RepID=A0A9N9VFG6_9HYPO|nr:unnamed protein product [Clonostachys rhizophaga]
MGCGHSKPKVVETPFRPPAPHFGEVEEPKICQTRYYNPVVPDPLAKMSTHAMPDHRPESAELPRCKPVRPPIPHKWRPVRSRYYGLGEPNEPFRHYLPLDK